VDNHESIQADWDHSTHILPHGACSDIHRAYAEWEKRTGISSESWYVRCKRKQKQRREESNNENDSESAEPAA